MARAVYLVKAKPGKMKGFLDYLAKNRLSDEALKSAGVQAWSVFVQADNVLVYLEASDFERLRDNPEVQKFDKGEANFLEIPERLTPMEEVLRYPMVDAANLP